MKFRRGFLKIHCISSDIWLKQKDVPLGTQNLQVWNRVDKLKAEYRLLLWVTFVILDLKKTLPVHELFFPTLRRSHRMTVFLHAFCLAYDLKASWKKALLIKYKKCSQANNSGPMLITFSNVQTYLLYPPCWLHCITWANGKLLFQPAKCHQIQMEPTWASQCMLKALSCAWNN